MAIVKTTWLQRAKVAAAILTKRQSILDEVLGPMIQAVTVPIAKFNDFRIYDAVRGGYRDNNMVFRCVNIIADNLVTLDFEVFDKQGNPVDNHPVTALLDNPNPEMPPNTVKSIWWKQMELIGSTYIRFVRKGSKMELWPLYPDKVYQIPSMVPGQLMKGYYFQNNNGIAGNNVTLLPDEVVHLKQVDPSDGLAGISALRAGYRHVDILNEMDTWNFNSFKNRVLADIVISLKAENMSADQMAAIRDSIESQLAGSANARKAIIAPGATKVDKFSQTAVEMDFIEGRKLTREEVAMAYGVPLPVLGIYDHGTFNNVEASKRDFWEDTLTPKADNFCDTFTWFFKRVGLLAQDQKIGYKKQNIKALQRNYSDRVKDAAAVQTMLSMAGFESQSAFEEINRKFELGLDLESLEIAPEPTITIDPKTGLPVTVPGKPNMEAEPGDDPPAAAGSEDTSEEGDPSKGSTSTGSLPNTSNRSAKREAAKIQAREFHWRMVDKKRQMATQKAQRAFKTVFKEEQGKVLSVLNDHKHVDTQSLIRAIRQNDKAWSAAYTELYTSVIKDFGKPVKQKRASGGFKGDNTHFNNLMDERISSFVSANAGKRVTQIRGVSQAKVEKIVSDAMDRYHVINKVAEQEGVTVQDYNAYMRENVYNDVSALYDDFSISRAATIARTEVLSAASYGQETAMSLSGVQSKQWVTSKDDQVRDSHQEVDEEEVNIDENFSNGLRFPGDPTGDGGEIINCRCALMAGDSSDNSGDDIDPDELEDGGNN